MEHCPSHAQCSQLGNVQALRHKQSTHHVRVVLMPKAGAVEGAARPLQMGTNSAAAVTEKVR